MYSGMLRHLSLPWRYGWQLSATEIEERTACQWPHNLALPHRLAHRLRHQLALVHHLPERRGRQRLEAIGEGLVRLGVNLDDDAVRPCRDRRPRHRPDEARLAGAVRRIDHDRQ